jgi:hypothetical protein
MSSAVRFGWGSKGTTRGGGSNQSQIIESSTCEHRHQLFYISRFINSIKFYYSILFFYFFYFYFIEKNLEFFSPKKREFFSVNFTLEKPYIYIYIYPIFGSQKWQILSTKYKKITPRDLLEVARGNQHPPTTASCRMDDKWLGNKFLVGFQSLGANHGY